MTAEYTAESRQQVNHKIKSPSPAYGGVKFFGPALNFQRLRNNFGTLFAESCQIKTGSRINIRTHSSTMSVKGIVLKAGILCTYQNVLSCLETLACQFYFVSVLFFYH